MYLHLRGFFFSKLLQTCPITHNDLQYELNIQLNTYTRSCDPNIAPTHEQCEETNEHTREYLNYHIMN